MNKTIIFDWMGTLYERDKGAFTQSEQVLQTAKAKGYKLVLISLTKDQTRREKEIQASGLAGYFDVLYIVAEKTPEIYQKAIDAVGSSSKATLVVDDRTVRGIKVGNQLGCKTYWIKRGEYALEVPTTETGEPTQTLNNLEEILNFI